MGLVTLSQFFYGHDIDNAQRFLSIDEGTGEIAVELNANGYSFSELGIELERALNEAGLLTYTVTTDRVNRKFTISSSANFSILAGSGSYVGSSVYLKLGFNGVDKTGASSYESDFSTGTVYRPQFNLYNYLPTKHRIGSNQATQDESGNGQFQIVSFGTVQYMECEMRFITNRADKPSVIEKDLNATENVMAFLNYARLKNRIEFMEDRNNPQNFEKFILFRTGQSNQGIEIRLDEMTDFNLQDYYRTGLLTFRKVT